MKAIINSSKVCSSKFLTCSIRQILSDFSTVKVLRYTVRTLLKRKIINLILTEEDLQNSLIKVRYVGYSSDLARDDSGIE